MPLPAWIFEHRTKGRFDEQQTIWQLKNYIRFSSIFVPLILPIAQGVDASSTNCAFFGQVNCPSGAPHLNAVSSQII